MTEPTSQAVKAYGLLIRARKAQQAKAAAERRWREAILAAHRGGVSARMLGQDLGLSKTRIMQIVHEEEGDDGR
jgi:hypothetical protein